MANGLAVAQGMVKAHGGRIVVTSEVGKGTTFAVFLPVSDYSFTSASQVPLPAAAIASLNLTR